MQDLELILKEMKEKYGVTPLEIRPNFHDEVYLKVNLTDFPAACLALHKMLVSPVMTFFALDDRQNSKSFLLYAGFIIPKSQKWIFVELSVPGEKPEFNSIARQIYSANLFEREIKEQFGLIPIGNPDGRRLNLHDEVWPAGSYPLRKDFDSTAVPVTSKAGEYPFIKVEGEGIFEVPVGPVHAGIIPPGHFRFSVAGEPIINLEIRLGFKHRGIEKLFEGKQPAEMVKLAECVAGDSAFAHSLAYCQTLEKISGLAVPARAQYLRALFLELERMYNHVADAGSIALDVGLTFPAALGSVIKEALQQLNDDLCGSRFLKGINCLGGVVQDLDPAKIEKTLADLKVVMKDFQKLKNILNESASFQDRVESTGILRRKTAEDFGVLGLAGRASGIALDLRQKAAPYDKLKFKMMMGEKGDVKSRLDVRLAEFEESARLVREILTDLPAGEIGRDNFQAKAGQALGYVEGWRGPVLYWVKTNEAGLIERCKIVDPSFHNWLGLSYAVHGNIIPDFPVCNKSFNLSYSGNDL